MKTILKIIIYSIFAIGILVSCEEQGLDPLTGKYAPPEVYHLTKLETQNRERDGALYVFSINLTDEESNILNLNLVADDYILPGSDYTPSSVATKNTYLTGSDGTTFNGLPIESGTISIAVQDSIYSVSGILYMPDETVLKLSGTFIVAYKPDLYLPTYTYSVETQTPAMGGSDGSVEISGTTMNKLSIFADGLLYAYLEIVTIQDANSLTGTYVIKDGIDAAGQINNGYYLDWSWWGGEGIVESGSYLVESDEKLFLRESEGNITITENEGTLSVEGESLSILDLETLISSGGSTWQNLSVTKSLNIQDATLADN